MASPRSLTVHLAGLDLGVRTTADEADVQRIVALIEARLKDVKKSATTQPLHNHLALVAMSLAQELLQTQQQHDAFLDDLEAMSADMLGALGDDDA